MSLDHPYWIDDPNFDIDFHIRHMSLAPPGRHDQLAEQVARIVGRPMDRTRPLWEVYVIEGLEEDGHWALLTKYHHATIDGASGVMMLTLMNDLSPDAEPPGESPPWRPEPIPSDLELLRLAIANLVRNPAQAARVQLRMVRDVAEAAGVTGVGAAAQRAGDCDPDARRTARRPAPRLAPADRRAPDAVEPQHHGPPPLRHAPGVTRRPQATEGRHRRHDQRRRDGDLRRCVAEIPAEHDALPDRPLRAMVPVSIRTGDEEDTWTNRVSGLAVDLPTHLDDPLERLAACREAMDEAKRQFELVPAEALVDIQQYRSPVVATAAMRLAPRLKLADRMDPPMNLIISNVPGPRQALYLDGAKMLSYIPVSRSARAKASTSRSTATSTSSCSASSPAGSWCPTCGTWSTCTSTRSTC